MSTPCFPAIPDISIESVAYACMTFQRPRCAGRNARRDVHGSCGDVHIVRLTAGQYEGFGWCTASKEEASSLLGRSLASLFDHGTLLPQWQSFEFPLLDLLGQITQQPVYSFFSDAQKIYRVPVYDSSIYIDEPDSCTNEDAISLIMEEIEQGLSAGHRNFKIKVGRSAIWMDVAAGMERDVSIVREARKKIGSNGRIMADANNGWNYNLTREFLERTRDVGLYWLEEPFAEDEMVLERLREWMAKEKLSVALTDGEGCASPRVEEWACRGLLDYLQFDVRGHGFFQWIETASRIAPYGVRPAPHNYGGYYANYAQAHLAAALPGYDMAEWDECHVCGIDDSGYTIRDGFLYVPNTPGFGLKFDGKQFDTLSHSNGWYTDRGKAN